MMKVLPLRMGQALHCDFTPIPLINRVGKRKRIGARAKKEEKKTREPMR
jgi:hypothetical protein